MRATPVLIMLVIAGCLGPGIGSLSTPTATADAPIVGQTHSSGYIKARDGTLLAYDLVLPGDGTGSFPTLLTYDGYDAGSNVDPGYVARYVPKGYALIGVSVRGTGCSGGTFDFFEPVQAKDGYDAIEWAASQGWSNGRVAMIGKSYPGITQLFVAEEKPPHLVAAAPGHVYGDIYRDVAYPGGVFNYAFAGLWSFLAQPEPGYATAMQKKNNDPVCMQNVLQHTATNARWNPFLQAQEHRFDDALIRERSPTYNTGRIDVPLYLFQSWQDEQVGVRGVNVVERMSTNWYLTLSNGDHGMYRTNASLERLDRFFDHFVKQIDNGFQNEPRVLVWWEAGADGVRAPSWTTSYAQWPVQDVTPLELHLRAGGKLAPTAATGPEPADAYVYPGGSTSNQAGYGYGSQTEWQVTNNVARTPPPTRLVYATDPLAQDVTVLGPANLTLHLSSTATDTDVQVVVNEVRPDGKVVYVQKGWLRASHRALDGEASSPFRPYQSHQSEAPLTPGEPVALNIEVFPFGQVFRAGSRIQLVIESPTVLPELWGSVLTPEPGVDQVLHDATHDSFLRLPVLPGAVAGRASLPACGSLIRQSCV